MSKSLIKGTGSDNGRAILNVTHVLDIFRPKIGVNAPSSDAVPTP